MQVILVSNRLAVARTIHIKVWHIVAVFAIFMVSIFSGAAVLSWLSIQWRLPLIQDILVSMQRQEAANTQNFVTGNLQALAARVGELQARMVRLDGLGERLTEKAGIGAADLTRHPQEVKGLTPQGGPFVPAPLSEQALREEIDRLAAQIESGAQRLNAVDARLRQDMVQQELLPTTLPVQGGANLGSPFGTRLDPFGRGRAMHEGLDFVAPPGTPVVSAAGGVVVNAAYHPEFGNLVEVNHGGQLITRYAHLASMSVQPGMAVREGQVLGTLGSTGRSTGPHLHFEVRQEGAALDPAVFLRSPLARSH